MERKRKERPPDENVEGTFEAIVNKGKHAFSGVGGDGAVLAVLEAKKPVSKDLTQENLAFPQIQRPGLERFWNSRTFSDITLLVGDEEISSHRLVLATQSQVLNAKLERWTDAETGPPRIRIELPDPIDTVADFKEVLKFMYCGTCRITSHSVLGLLHISNYYEVSPLKEACGEFLFELLSSTNVGMLLELSEKYGMRSLRKLLSVHMATNFESLLQSGALWDLSLGVWEEILRREVLAVPDEAAVLNAVREYVRRLPEQEQQYALMQLLPCVRMPLLGVKTLVAEIESDNKMMSIPGAKDLVYHAFRHLLLTSQAQTVSEVGAEASALLAEAPLPGPSSSASTSLVPHQDARLTELMQLQGRVRKQLVSFDHGLSLGFELSAGRTVATVQATGGLAEGPHPFDDNDDRPPHGRGPDLIRRGRDREPRGRPNQQMAIRGAGPLPPPLRGPGGPAQVGSAAGEGERTTRYVTVTPGVSEGCQFIELNIRSSHTTPQNVSDMCIWVVKSPNVEPGLGRNEGKLMFDQLGCAYVSGSNGQNMTTGVVTKVLPPYIRGRIGLRQLGLQHLQDANQVVEGYGPGDTIGISIKISEGRSTHYAHDFAQRTSNSQIACVTFYKNKNMIHRVTIPCSLPTRASMHGGRHGGVGPAVLGPNARERGAGGGNASGGGAAGATASAAASTAAVWQVMVSSKHAGDTIAVVRPAAAKILSKERQDQGLSEAAKAKGNKNKRKRAAQDDAVAGQRMQFVERMNRLAIPLPVMYPPGLYADDPYLDNLGAGNYLYNDEDYDSFDDEDLDEDEVDLY